MLPDYDLQNSVLNDNAMWSLSQTENEKSNSKNNNNIELGMVHDGSSRENSRSVQLTDNSHFNEVYELSKTKVQNMDSR